MTWKCDTDFVILISVVGIRTSAGEPKCQLWVSVRISFYFATWEVFIKLHADALNRMTNHSQWKFDYSFFSLGFGPHQVFFLFVSQEMTWKKSEKNEKRKFASHKYIRINKSSNLFIILLKMNVYGSSDTHTLITIVFLLLLPILFFFSLLIRFRVDILAVECTKCKRERAHNSIRKCDFLIISLWHHISCRMLVVISIIKPISSNDSLLNTTNSLLSTYN